jgi:hypothetical protein
VTSSSGYAGPTFTTTPENGSDAAGLTADHVKEVGAGGRPDGHLVVRCRSCNATRSAHLAHRVLTAMQVNDPSPAEVSDTLRTQPPPVVG